MTEGQPSGARLMWRPFRRSYAKETFCDGQDTLNAYGYVIDGCARYQITLMGARPLTINTLCWNRPASPDAIITARAMPATWRDQIGELFHWVPSTLQRAAGS